MTTTDVYSKDGDGIEGGSSKLELMDRMLPSKETTEEVDYTIEDLQEDLEEFQQDAVIQQALAGGMDCREYAKQVERELRAIEQVSILDYIDEGSNILDIYHEIDSCDHILSHMQEMLLGFQADLSGISDEIRHLQDESNSMNIKLTNRKQVGGDVQDFLDKILVPKKVIIQIQNHEIDENYIDAVKELNDRITFINRKELTGDPMDNKLMMLPSHTMAVKDLQVEMNKLRTIAITRIREFFATKINDLKKPKTNVQMFQQNVMLKMKDMMAFLSAHAPEIASEIRSMYVEAMSKILWNLFRAYYQSLTKLQDESMASASKVTLVSTEEHPTYGTPLMLMKGKFLPTKPTTKRTDAFALNNREQILDAVSAPPIMIHVAQAEGKKYPYEALFRSIQQHLMNSATSEYFFIIDFFKKKPKELFLQVFASTLSLCLENLENYLFSCHDAIALLLMINLTHAQRMIMEKRRIPSLDSYFDRVTMLLWPRFKAVFDQNVASLQTCKIKKLGVDDLHPHYVTRRYAEFVSSVLSLHGLIDSSSVQSRDMANEMVLNNLAVLRQQLINLLLRFAAATMDPKYSMIFLINSYDAVLSAFHERMITSEETTKFEELLAEQRDFYVEYILRETFAALIDLVRSTEHKMATQNPNPNANGGSVETLDVSQIEPILKHFKSDWKKWMKSTNGQIFTCFVNFRNGMEILKLVLTQMLLYYTRFIDVIKKSGGPSEVYSSRIAPMLISTPEILAEIKTYSQAF